MAKAPHFSMRKKQTKTSLSPKKVRAQRLSDPKKKMKKEIKRRKNWLSESLFFLLIAVIILFFWGFKTHRVSGESMKPTFETNDRIIVKKNTLPKRYEIVTFDPEIPGDPSYVKRVIGVPGDQIWTDSHAIYIRPSNATPWKQEEVSEMVTSMLPDSTLKIITSDEVALNLKGIATIPKGNYFVLGDNRAASKDSRKLGLIKEKQVEGIVVFRYFPFNKMGFVH
ncbi:signal peptidase I [Enterococcus sp. AZ126]|uniref:signal peptidase I n=1 Tax=Enterococcus sp. AZ126 TaxID=2774635 RepID=UPI003F22CFA9